MPPPITVPAVSHPPAGVGVGARPAGPTPGGGPSGPATGKRSNVVAFDQRPAAAGFIGIRLAALMATFGPALGRRFIGAARPPF
jgi:hypothetical protein